MEILIKYRSLKALKIDKKSEKDFLHLHYVNLEYFLLKSSDRSIFFLFVIVDNIVSD